MKNPTTLRLPSWAGYRAGKAKAPSDGIVEVRFHGTSMTPLQRTALLAAERRDAARYDALIDAILVAYPTFRPWKSRPKSMTKAQLKSHIAPWELIALKDQHEGVAYIAYGFSCSWDPSGLDVVMHGDRVVAVGDSDVLGYPIRDPMRTPPALPLPSEAQRRAARVKAEKRAKKNPKTLRFDDLGMLTVHLPCWAGFVNRPGEEPASGEVMIELEGDWDDAQEAAYRHVLDNAESMQAVVCDAIVAMFAKLRKRADAEVELPARVDRAALHDLIDLRSVTLHPVDHGGVGYVGYQLGCRWDREHGLGVMTHLDRVVEVGSADTAILEWIAEKDLRARKGMAPAPIKPGAARKAKPAAAAKKAKPTR